MRGTRDSIADIWGDRTPYVDNWPTRVDERILEEPERWIQSACILCSNGCGMDIGVKDNRIVGVRGRAVDAVNHGRLGPKGLHGWVANHSADRLRSPLIRRNGQLETASWDEAMDLIVRRSQEICDKYTSGAIGFYTSGQLFLEEYYTLGVIGKAGLGTPHMDGNTRLCTATAAAALQETFGSDGQPGSYTDLISHQAIEPPAEARSDLNIFLDYARRMDFRDKDGEPLIKWNDPEGAFEAWKECTRDRSCDYTGLSYAKLTGGSGIQWPCNERFPNGTPHLYTDGVFNTSSDYCENFGHNLVTGAAIEPEEYRASDPKGKAVLKAADYQPPHEQPDKEYPFWLTTGRIVYHFHTRTKTGRSKELNDAAPDAFVQISTEDAVKYGIQDGDAIEVTSRRGRVVEPARVGDIESEHLFIPFHYGYWDKSDRPRAANELTITEWDPVSKQPHFKYAAVRICKLSK